MGGVKKIHFGWWVCVGCMMVAFVTGGLANATYNNYMPYIEAAGSFSSSQVSAIATVRYVGKLVSLSFIDVYFRRLDIRRGAVLSMLMVAAVMFICGNANDVLLLYCIANFLSGLAYGIGATTVAALMMTRWFDDRRGMATGLAVAGTGVAHCVMPPLIVRTINLYGLQTAFRAEGVLTLLLTVPAAFLLCNHPEEKQLKPYRTGKKVDTVGVKDASKPVYQMPASHLVWMVIAMAALSAAANVGNNFLSLVFSEAGRDSGLISALLSYMGICVMLGKTLFGVVADRAGRLKTTWLFGGLLIAGNAIILLAGTGSTALLFLLITFIGLGYSQSTVGLPLYAVDLNDEAHYVRAVKYLQIGYAIGSIAFTQLTGLIADTVGSYYPAFVMYALCNLFTVIVITAVYARRASCMRDDCQRFEYIT